jgi:hypothetical protein
MTDRDRHALAAGLAMLNHGFPDYAETLLRTGEAHAKAVLATLRAAGVTAAITDAKERMDGDE